MTPLALDAQTALASANLAAIREKTVPSGAAKARAQAQDFEAVFLSTMFQHMFTNVGNEGPLGNSPAVGVWRSFLTDAYAKSLAQRGGVGLADPVYRSLMAQQEVAK
jgi:Rod binding domain-containing protein